MWWSHNFIQHWLWAQSTSHHLFEVRYLVFTVFGNCFLLSDKKKKGDSGIGIMETKFNIVLLNGANYATWKIQGKRVFMKDGL